jgi:hypothetical protein
VVNVRIGVIVVNVGLLDSDELMNSGISAVRTSREGCQLRRRALRKEYRLMGCLCVFVSMSATY